MATSIFGKTRAVPLAQSDRELLERACHRLEAICKAKELPDVRLFAEDKPEEGIVLPESAVHLLSRVLTALAAGHAVTIFHQGAELTTQEAADLLNVSRPFLVK